MAYTEVTVQKPGVGAQLTTAAPTQLGNCFDNDGQSVIIFTTGAEALDLWIHTTQEGPGGIPMADLYYRQPANETHVIGPFPKSVYNHGGLMNELVTIHGNSAVAAETFTITYSAQTTGALAWNAAPNDFLVALEGLSTIGEGNIRMIDKCQSSDGPHFVFEFCGALGHANRTAVTTTDTAPLANTVTTVDGGANTHIGQVLIDYDELVPTADGPDVTNAFISVVSSA